MRSTPTRREAVAGADAVYTDVWVRMGDEATADAAPRRWRPTALDDALLRRAPRPARSRCTACPPTRARRSPRPVLYGERQAIWDQAENRLHAQKAMLEWLLGVARHVT